MLRLAFVLVIAAVLVAVYVSGMLGPTATARVKLVPKVNGTFTSVYNVELLCIQSKVREMANTSLVYRGWRLVEVEIDGKKLPPSIFKYPHEPTHVGEMLIDLRNVTHIERAGGNGTLTKSRDEPSRIRGENAETKLTPRSLLRIEARSHYNRLEVPGGGEFINATIGGFLLYDDEAGVPYFFNVIVSHPKMREVCGSSFVLITAYLSDVR
ncbi:MAG: hypothetical protein ABWK05_09505 [Pyrobaculum sp.]